MSETVMPFTGVDKARARDFYNKAEIKFNEKNWHEAREALVECLKYDPTNREAIELTATLFLKTKQTKSAMKIIDNYLKVLTPTKEYYFLKAKANLQARELNACKEALDRCFEFKRDYEPGLFLLGDYFYQSGKINEAINIYERLHEKDKNNKDILFSLAVAYHKKNDWDGAIIYCSKLKDLNVDNDSVNQIYKTSLDEKKKGLKHTKNRTFLQNLFAFIYDPETEKQLRIHSEQEWQLKRANQKGYLDEKTGILNFQALQDHFPALASQSYEKNENVFIGFLDINFFKYYNDFYGSHAVGDMVLKAVARLGSDLFPGWFFRRSGDEFVFVHTGTVQSALDKAELFRKTAENQALDKANELIYHADPPLINKATQKPYVIDRKVSISVGLAKYKTDGNDLTTLLQAAEDNFKLSHDTRKNAVVYEGKIVSSGEIPDKPLVGGR